MTSQEKNGAFSADAAVDRFQEMSERLLETSRKASTAYLDATEKTVAGLADLEVKIADASQVEWIAAAATAQADLTRDFCKLYTSTARELLAK
jgi:hypothetical protein